MSAQSVDHLRLLIIVVVGSAGGGVVVVCTGRTACKKMGTDEDVYWWCVIQRAGSAGVCVCVCVLL
jgi:hypothetical protein